ncbi:transposase, partial [Bacteroides pyogenes]
KAKELLCSKEGLKHRGQRCIEPEAVFGQIKNNMNYKRFRHFGKDKVFMDFSFLAIAFNIKKMCAKMTKEGMDWLIRLFYELTAALFKCWKHINQRNLQNIAA